MCKRLVSRGARHIASAFHVTLFAVSMCSWALDRLIIHQLDDPED